MAIKYWFSSLDLETFKKDMKEKYTCPMHPDVISDKPGKCPKCGGMDLVKIQPSSFKNQNSKHKNHSMDHKGHDHE